VLLVFACVLAPDQNFARIGAGSWPAASSVVPPALAASEFLNASLRNTTRAPPRPSPALTGPNFALRVGHITRIG